MRASGRVSGKASGKSPVKAGIEGLVTTAGRRPEPGGRTAGAHAGGLLAAGLLAALLVAAACAPVLAFDFTAARQAHAGPGGTESSQGPAEADAAPEGRQDGLDLAGAIRAALRVSPHVRLAELQVAEAELALLAAEVKKSEGDLEAYLEAQHALEQARTALEGAVADAAVQAEEAFYNVLRAQELLELRQRAAEQAAARAAVARARHEAGMLSQVDLLEVELSHARAAAAQHDAERSLEAARRALSELTGIDPLPPLQWSRDALAFAPVEVSLAGAMDKAVRASSDVTAARFALRAAERRLELARLSDFPAVDVRRAEMEVERAAIRLAEAEAAIRREVRLAYDALLAAAHNVSLEEQALALALQRLDIARTRHDAGTLPLVELFAEEGRAMEARLNAASALWDYNLKKARFLRLTGEAAPLERP